MNLSLERLLADPTAITDSPLVGSYIVGVGNNVIHETEFSGEYALDVNLRNASITVTATDLDIRDLDSASDSVAAVQSGTWSVQIDDGADTLEINADGSINSVVTATDLDIRDLTHVSDSIKVGDGTDFLAVNADGSINVQFTSDADGAALTKNPLHVGSAAFDQASVWNAVDAGDAASLASDLYRRVLINDAPNIAVASEATTIGTTAAVVATALAGRTRLMVQNSGDKSIFVGPAAVTTASGIEISKGGTLSLELGEAVDLYAISTAAGQDVRVMQLA